MRTAFRHLLALFYFMAGVAHLVAPAGFVQITPLWVPLPDMVVQFTGICEIVGALALSFVPGLRRAAGLALAIYAVAVFPANINHTVNDIAVGGADLSWWYHGPRLVFQPVIIWWALWVGDVTDWPFGAKR
jgi:uncharacterized membrane protein